MKRPEPKDVEREVKSIDLIVSKSDAEGNITYANPIFIKISGYSQASLLEKPHSILRHPDMPKAVFRYMWNNIKEGRDVVAFVKNLCSDGSYYWVLATVKMAKNPDGSFRNYLSTRKAVTKTAKNQIAALYKSLLDIEKSEGDEASWEAFNNFLSNNNIHDNKSFNAFMKQLNKEEI